MAVPWAHRRWILTALALATLPVELRSQDRFTLWGDYPTAVAHARLEGRLLFVLDLSGDFTTPGIPGQEGSAYQALALNARVRELLGERFVAAMRNVGMPSSLNLVAERGKLKEGKPNPQHAMAYVCLPDERVVHFIPGFVTAEQLDAELAWAEQCYLDLIRFPAHEQPIAARQSHLDAIDPIDLELLSKRTQSGWLLDQPTREYSAAHLASAVRTVRQLRQTRLDDRFAGEQNALVARSFYHALADHGGLETTCAHAVLAEFPLPPLADLAGPLYSTWFADHYWQLSPRRGELKEWFTQRVGKGKPILLVVTSPAAAPGEAEPRSQFAWPPRDGSDLPIAEFDVLDLTLAELTVMMTDAGHAPLVSQRQELPRFVVYDRAGRRKAVLSQRDGISKLRLAMRASVQPGVAKASGPTKRRDE